MWQHFGRLLPAAQNAPGNMHRGLPGRRDRPQLRRVAAKRRHLCAPWRLHSVATDEVAVELAEARVHVIPE